MGRQRASRVNRFFTFWAFFLHCLYMVGLFPNTFSIAALVFIGSRVHGIFDRHTTPAIDFFFHWLPVLVIPPTAWNWPLVIIMVSLYFFVNEGPLEVLKFYGNSNRYFFE